MDMGIGSSIRNPETYVLPLKLYSRNYLQLVEMAIFVSVESVGNSG